MTRLRLRALPLPFAAVLLLCFVAACDEAGGSSGPGGGRAPSSLAGAAWVVASVSGQAPIPGGEPTVAFTQTTVSGSAGCNQYSGRYQYDPSTGRLTIGDVAMTAMACLEDRRNAFETLFSNALRQVDHAEVDPAGRLVLGGPGGVIVLTNGRIPVGAEALLVAVSRLRYGTARLNLVAPVEWRGLGLGSDWALIRDGDK